MTRHDFMVKWGVYALALLPVWLLEAYICSHPPLFAVKPMLTPLAVVAVAVLEGGTAGAGFGLWVGVLTSTVYPDGSSLAIIGLAILGLWTGLLAQYLLRQDLLGCLLCSALGLLSLDAVRVLLWLLARKGALEPMLVTAGSEIICSMLFVAPIYGIFLWVFHRVPKGSHF